MTPWVAASRLAPIRRGDRRIDVPVVVSSRNGVGLDMTVGLSLGAPLTVRLPDVARAVAGLCPG